MFIFKLTVIFFWGGDTDVVFSGAVFLCAANSFKKWIKTISMPSDNFYGTYNDDAGCTLIKSFSPSHDALCPWKVAYLLIIGKFDLNLIGYRLSFVDYRLTENSVT